MNIDILCSDKSHPVVKKIHKLIDRLSNGEHVAKIFYDKSELYGGDILFLVSCSHKVERDICEKYRASLVLHASELPVGRGWSPHIWAILSGESCITVSLIEADEKIDSGKIWLQHKFYLDGHELFDEINEKLFNAELLLMEEAIEKFSDIQPKSQMGNPGPYLRKRSPSDSRIDPQKSIAQQFNLLRVADPARYPAFFEYMGSTYLLKIEKVKK